MPQSQHAFDEFLAQLILLSMEMAALAMLLGRKSGFQVCGASSSDDGLRRVRAGTLDDTSWLRPTAHFWTRSKQPWVTLPEGDQVFETQPG